jgi:hypothetical protein
VLRLELQGWGLQATYKACKHCGRPRFAWTSRGNAPCSIPVINLQDRGHVVFETSHFIAKGICEVTLPEVGSASRTVTGQLLEVLKSWARPKPSYMAPARPISKEGLFELQVYIPPIAQGNAIAS